MICPSCNGYGEYSFPEASSIDMSDGWHKCDRCNGTGKLKKCAACGGLFPSDDVFWPDDSGDDKLCIACWEKECSVAWWDALADHQMGIGWDYRYMWE